MSYFAYFMPPHSNALRLERRYRKHLIKSVDGYEGAAFNVPGGAEYAQMGSLRIAARFPALVARLGVVTFGLSSVPRAATVTATTKRHFETKE